MSVSILVVLVLLCFICQTSAFSHTNFQIKRFELCNNTQGLFKFHGNVSESGGNFYADGFIDVSMMLDENIGSTLKIDTKVGVDFVELFVIREKCFCKAANVHMGEMWYDFERASGAIPGLCPIPPKRYSIRHTLMDFRKMSLQTFPFGRLRFTARLIDNKHPENNLICLIIEVDNVVN